MEENGKQERGFIRSLVGNIFSWESQNKGSSESIVSTTANYINYNNSNGGENDKDYNSKIEGIKYLMKERLNRRREEAKRRTCIIHIPLHIHVSLAFSGTWSGSISTLNGTPFSSLPGRNTYGLRWLRDDWLSQPRKWRWPAQRSGRRTPTCATGKHGATRCNMVRCGAIR